jgi:hypothetical protein
MIKIKLFTGSKIEELENSVNEYLILLNSVKQMTTELKDIRLTENPDHFSIMIIYKITF